MLQSRISRVEALPDYRLNITFATGEVGVFDVKPYIEGSWYGLLQDPSYFRTVHVVDGGKGIEWADGQDIAPHELYEQVCG